MTALRALMAKLPDFRSGTVWLVGAGPGDPGLLTLAAAHALATADVIVYDALVGEEILSLVPGTAVLEFAGKRGGKPSHVQQDITERLIVLARAGKRVLRLKGGDPFVFGRGGEEAVALVKADIPFRVVPGITSGLAGLAVAGIPATTRDTNQAVTLVTGHTAAEGAEGIDWAAHARTGAALVLYMAMGNLPVISAALIAGGMAADTPVGIVTEATRPSQRVLVTVLDRAAADAAAAGLKAPAIVAIGPIVALRAVLGPGLEAATLIGADR